MVEGKQCTINYVLPALSFLVPSYLLAPQPES